MLRLICGLGALVLWAAACAPASGATFPTAPAATETASAHTLPTVIPTTQAPAPAPTNTPAAAATLPPTNPATRAPATSTRAGSAKPTATGGASPAVQGQDCGRVMTLGPNPPRDPSALQAENCFWQAYQECRAATLVVQLQGVDAGTTSTFTLKKETQCVIADTEQTFFAARPPLPANNYTCSGLVRKDGGLLFQACGRAGDILVPAPQAP